MPEENQQLIRQKKVEDDWKQGVSYTQDNELITSAYTMSLRTRRLFILGCSKINPLKPPIPIDSSDSLEKLDASKPIFLSHTFNVTVEEWSEHWPSANPWRDMKMAADELSDSSLFIKKADGEVRKLSWTDEVIYHKDKASITVTLGNALTTKFSGLMGDFTRIKILEVGKLRSQYSIKLYELIKRWSSGLAIYSVEDLRRMFSTHGKYSRFAEFKRNVIQPAVKEINKNSPKRVEVEYQKRGRKITHVKFFCVNVSKIEGSTEEQH